MNLVMSFKKIFILSLILLVVSVAGCTGSFDNLPYNISSTDYANLSGMIENNLNQLSCVNQTVSADPTGSVLNGRVQVEISHELFFNGQNVNSKFMYLIDIKRTPEKFFPKYSDFVPDIFGSYYLYVDTSTGRIYTSPTINITVDEELHDGFFTDSDWRWLYSAVTKCYDYSLINSNVCSGLSIEEFSESLEGNSYIRDAQCLTDQKDRHWWSQMNLIYDGKVRSNPEPSEESPPAEEPQAEENLTFEGFNGSERCWSDASCPWNQECYGGLFSIPPGRGVCKDIDCPDGKIKNNNCIPNLCQVNSDCTSGYRCESESNKCVPNSDCTIIQDSGSGSGTLDITFIGAGFNSISDVHQLAEGLAGRTSGRKRTGILGSSPFNKYSGRINIRVANQQSELDVGTTNMWRETPRFTRKNIASQERLCPENDVVITLVDKTLAAEKGVIVPHCSGSTASTCFIPLSGTSASSDDIGATLHELGHAFAHLAEEYEFTEKSWYFHSGISTAKPNCAPDLDIAENWWGDLAEKYPADVGYYIGCGYGDENIRPHRMSVMRDYRRTHSYGLVNELEIEKTFDRYSYFEPPIVRLALNQIHAPFGIGEPENDRTVANGNEKSRKRQMKPREERNYFDHLKNKLSAMIAVDEKAEKGRNGRKSSDQNYFEKFKKKIDKVFESDAPPSRGKRVLDRERKFIKKSNRDRRISPKRDKSLDNALDGVRRDFENLQDTISKQNRRRQR